MTELESSAVAPSLVLSLFPGADLLGRGFEAEGFCIVRGPDILWGHDVRDFTPARHKFEGVIGGSPCQDFSKARRCAPTGEGMEMVGQFLRCVMAAEPLWFLLENVPGVPDVADFCGHWLTDNRWTVQRFNLRASECGCRQTRLRCLQFGWRDGLGPLIPQREMPLVDTAPAAMASEGRRKGRRTWADFCALQGLPRAFALPGLSRGAAYRAVGNGVPVPMARVLAEAVRARRGEMVRLCLCACGRPVKAGRTLATPACRKRVQRERDAAGVTDARCVTGAESQTGMLFDWNEARREGLL